MMLDQYDRYRLASPPDDEEEPQEGDLDWTGDFDPEEHLNEEGDDY